MESCVCLMVEDDGGGPRIINLRKARDRHFCTECGEMIDKGEVYERAWFPGEETYKTCETCLSVRDDIMKCGFYYGEVWFSIFESCRDGLPYHDNESLAELEAMMPWFWRVRDIEREVELGIYKEKEGK